MGKEVKVTASESLTADKGVRIGKTMGKSDEPTLIPIDKDLGGAKKKTANKTTKKTDGVNKREAEKISDAADALVLDDVKPVKKPVKKVAKTPVTSKKATTKALVMDGMVRQKGVAKAKPVDVKGDLDVKADSLKLDESELIEDGEESTEKVGGKSKKQLSKPKATVIAIGVAVLVGVAGMILMFFLNRPTSTMCILQFESNGGSKIESQEVVCGTKASRPDDPEKEGFEFQDWLVEGMPFNFDEDTVDKDMVATAKWLVDANTEVVKITFDTAGGSEVTEREAVKGRPTTAPLDPTRDGYTFDGWYLNGEKFDFETPIDEDITLVAGWKDNNSGVVTRPQGNGNNSGGETANKQELQSLVLPRAGKMKVGKHESYQISVIPVSAEVTLEVNSDKPHIVDCVIENSHSMSCMAAEVGKATITVRDKNSGKTATMEIDVEAQESGGSSGGGSTGGGSGSTTPTDPDPGPGSEPEQPEPEEPDPTLPDSGTDTNGGSGGSIAE